VPENWFNLDNLELDLGSSGSLLVDVPGATPSRLVVALGKDRNMYLVNRDNLGGISAPIAVSVVASNPSGSRHLSDKTKHPCRATREQRRQHRPVRFAHYWDQSADDRKRLACEPGRRRLRLAFCHVY
jgi:hypothetical protein